MAGPGGGCDGGDEHPIVAAVVVTVVMDVVAGVLVARLHGPGAQAAADIAATLPAVVNPP